MSKRSINLLPADSLKAYHRDRAIAVSSRIVSGVGILAVLVIVFVGSAALYLSILTDANSERLKDIESSETVRQAGELEDKISGFAQELIILEDLKTKQYAPQFLVRKIVEVLPVNARLQRFQLVFEQVIVRGAQGASAETSNTPTLYLQGVADTRDDILAFEEAIVAFDFVERIEAPLSNIIQPEDAAFQFSLYLVPPAEALKVATEASELIEGEEDNADEENVVEDNTEEQADN